MKKESEDKIVYWVFREHYLPGDHRSEADLYVATRNPYRHCELADPNLEALAGRLVWRCAETRDWLGVRLIF